MNRHGIRRQRCFSLYVPPQHDKTNGMRTFKYNSFDESLCKTLHKMNDILSSSDGDLSSTRENFHKKLCRSEANFNRKTFPDKEVGKHAIYIDISLYYILENSTCLSKL